jgi:hypothetical protein
MVESLRRTSPLTASTYIPSGCGTSTATADGENKETDNKRARSALREFILTNIAQKKARAEAGKQNLGACV